MTSAPDPPRAPVALPEPTPSVTVQSTTTERIVSPGQSLLSRQLRNIIALALTATVIYLALMGDVTAQAAITAAFSVLVGMIFGERSSLKIPGVDK